MKRIKILSVLVTMAFCLGIVNPIFADYASNLGGGRYASDQSRFDFSDSGSKKPSQSYKAPKTKIQKYKNMVKVVKGSAKKSVSTKGLKNKQKKSVAKYAAKLAKQYDKKYNNASPAQSKKIVNAIAKKVKKKVNTFKKQNSSKKKKSYDGGYGNSYSDFVNDGSKGKNKGSSLGDNSSDFV